MYVFVRTILIGIDALLLYIVYYIGTTHINKKSCLEDIVWTKTVKAFSKKYNYTAHQLQRAQDDCNWECLIHIMARVLCCRFNCTLQNRNFITCVYGSK